jgi:hypothetical protein
MVNIPKSIWPRQLVFRWVDDEERRKKFVRANFGALAATFYPTVTTPKCVFAGKWLAWVC